MAFAERKSVDTRDQKPELFDLETWQNHSPQQSPQVVHVGRLAMRNGRTICVLRARKEILPCGKCSYRNEGIYLVVVLTFWEGQSLEDRLM